MNVSQALEHASAFSIPEFIFAGGEEAVQAERIKNEEAIQALEQAWFSENAPSFNFDIVRELGDRNRTLCDELDHSRLQNLQGLNLARALSDEDTYKAIATMQNRSIDEVKAEINKAAGSASVAYASHPYSGTVIGIDIETTSRNPDRGYIINVGWSLMDLAAQSEPYDGQTYFCGLPELYRQEGVPLSNIHGITWTDIDGKTQFREDKALQTQLLELLCTYPYMAHNAAFEDSWFMLHLDGYAEARRDNQITIIDSRDICRKLDPEVASALGSTNPASLENWAKRRGTLKADEKERHLSLDDTILMFKTVQAELLLKGLVR